MTHGADTCESLLAELLGPDADADAAVARWSRRLQAEEQSGALHLLTEAARLLGRQWVEDERSFADVTVAAMHLEALLRALPQRPAPAPPIAVEADATPPRCLLLAVPGEQHGFGVRMLAHVFRGRAWQVELATAADATELGPLVRQIDPDLVGFSLGAEMHLSRLARCIGAIRRLDPDVAIMVGGPVFVARPELARRVGADATAPDAETAVACANALIERRRTQARRPEGLAPVRPASPRSAARRPAPPLPQSTPQPLQCHSGQHECT